MKKAFEAIRRSFTRLFFVLAMGALLAACGGGGGGAGLALGPGTTTPTQPTTPVTQPTTPPAVTEYSQEVRYQQQITVELQGSAPGQTTGGGGAQIGLLNTGGSATMTVLNLSAAVILQFDSQNAGQAISSMTLAGDLPSDWIGSVVVIREEGTRTTLTLRSNSLEKVIDVSISPVVKEDKPAVEINFGSGTGGNQAEAPTVVVNTVTVVATTTVEHTVVRNTTEFVIENVHETQTVDTTVEVSHIENRRVTNTVRTTIDVTHYSTTTRIDTVYESAMANLVTVTNSLTAQVYTVEVVYNNTISVATATLATGTITMTIDEVVSRATLIKESAMNAWFRSDHSSFLWNIIVDSVSVSVLANYRLNTAPPSTDYNYFVNGTLNLPTEWESKTLDPLAIIYLPAVEITAPKPVVISNEVTTRTEEVTVEVTNVITNVVTNVITLTNRVVRTIENTISVTVVQYEYEYETVEQTVATVVRTSVETRTVTVTTAGQQATVNRVVDTVTVTNTLETTKTENYAEHTTAVETEYSGITNTIAGSTVWHHIVTVDGVSYILATSDCRFSQGRNANGNCYVQHINIYGMQATLHVDDSGYKRPVAAILPPARPASAPRDSITNFYEGSYWHGAINASNAYLRRYAGQGVTVAVIDSGVLVDHYALAGNIVDAARVSTGGGSTFITTTDLTDPTGHGSAVAGIIAASVSTNIGLIANHITIESGHEKVREFRRMGERGLQMGGIAPLAKLMPVQIGSNGSYPLPHVLRALQHVAEKNVPIVNNSYGDKISNARVRYMDSEGNAVTGTVSIPASPELFRLFTDYNHYPQVFRAIEEITRNKDMVMVWAAGNDGWNHETGRVKVKTSSGSTLTVGADFLITGSASISQDGSNYHSMSSLGLKADQVGVMGLAPRYEEALLGKWVAVVATDTNNTIASFSQACGAAKYWCVAAPGVSITAPTKYGDPDALQYGATNKTYKKWDGTSFAAPVVSGALAVLKSRFPAMPMNAILAILFKTATDIGEQGIDDVYGHGLINLGKAITVQGAIGLAMPTAEQLAGSYKQLSLASLSAPSVVIGTDEYNANWGLDYINASVAYGHGYHGQGVTVAVVAQGVVTAHAQLSANIVPGVRFTLTNGRLTMETSGITAYLGNGTRMAGIIAAVKDDQGVHGVAPQAKIMPLQIADASGNEIYKNVAVSAVAHALDNSVHIINVNYHYPLYDARVRYEESGRTVTAVIPQLPVSPQLFIMSSPRLQSAYYGRISLINDEIADNDAVVVWPVASNGWNSAYDQTIRVDVIGGGNPSVAVTKLLETGEIITDGIARSLSFYGLSRNQPQIMAEAPLYSQGLVGKWVAVAGLTKDGDNVRIARQSNGCGRAMNWCLAAPGWGVKGITKDDGVEPYVRTSGTGTAAAHVSGALAVLKSRFTAMPMESILAILLKTADDLGEVGVDEVYGHGALNLGAAITVQGKINVATPDTVASNAVSATTSTTAQPSVVVISSAIPPLPPRNNVDYGTREYGAVQWWMGASVAYSYGFFGQGVTVAVVDNGVDTTYPDLSVNIVTGAQVSVGADGSVGISTGNFVDKSNARYVSHGTDVAGVIAGEMNGFGYHGVAPQAKVMPIWVMNEINHIKRDEYDDDLKIKIAPGQTSFPYVRGIAHALDNTVHIINNSYNFYIPSVTIRWVVSNSVTMTSTSTHMPISPELFSLYVTPNGEENSVLKRISLINDEVADNDAVLVWSTGQIPRLPEGDTGEFIVNGTAHAVKGLNLPDRQPGIMALAPIYHPELMGKWVAVTGIDANPRVVNQSNGCGRAMHWCLAASDTIDSIVRRYVAEYQYHNNPSAPSFAAASVSGALAVLKSRFTAMPMRSILAILFSTATDRGAPGVDEVYGHGELNLAAAITVQGLVSVAIVGTGAPGVTDLDSTTQDNSGNSGSRVGLLAMDFSPMKFAPGAGGIVRQLSGLQIAMSYLHGDYYFDTPLSKIRDFQVSEEFSLGNAAADMFDTPQRAGGETGAMAIMDTQNGKIHRAGYAGEEWRLEYDICTDCERDSWHMGRAEGIGNAYFGENQQGLGASWSPWSADAGELEVFSAVGLGEDGEEESYRQYGARWHDTLSSFSLMAELSEIQEDGSMLGNRGDVFGFTASQSRQARLALSGELGGWQWQGGYLHGWTDTGVNGRGLVSEVSDITYSQWHLEGMAKSLLRGDDEFRLGVSGMPQVRGEMRVNYLRASNEKFIDEFQFSLPTGVKAESMVLRNLSDKALVWRMGYKWRPLPTYKGMQAALGVETVSGGASDGDTAASFQLRWDF